MKGVAEKAEYLAGELIFISALLFLITAVVSPTSPSPVCSNHHTACFIQQIIKYFPIEYIMLLPRRLKSCWQRLVSYRCIDEVIVIER